jgi:hypothetical protein
VVNLDPEDAGCVVFVLALGASASLVVLAYALGQWICSGCLR